MAKFTETQKLLGLQFYKFLDEDNIDLKRVVAICNEEQIKVLDMYGKVSKINVSELEDYTKLTPDGLITVVVADMGQDSKGYNIEDVIVCLYRTKDMELGNYEPQIVCRQNITDFFGNYLAGDENENTLCGVSVTKDTCPENIDYSIMRACNGIKNNVAVNIYIEDNVDSILGLIKTKPFDRTLEACYNDHIKSMGGLHKQFYNKNYTPDGYCKTLEELLKINKFQVDFDSSYNILAIDEILEDTLCEINDDVFGKYLSLPQSIILALSYQLKLNIKDTIVVPYNHEIDLDELAGTKYLILRDYNNLLYIVNYTTAGEYRESDLEVIAAKEAMEKAKTLFGVNMDKYEN